MRIYLIRHGMTLENIQQRYIGQGDYLLCEEGINSLKKINIDVNFDYIISSPLSRCVDTAKIVFNNHKISLLEEDFAEIDFGNFEGKTYQQLKNDNEYISWISDFKNIAIPNGESYKEFRCRVLNAFNKLVTDIKLEKCNIGVVTHGGVIRTIIEEYCGIEFFSVKTEFGGGYILEFNNGQFTNKKLVTMEV